MILSRLTRVCAVIAILPSFPEKNAFNDKYIVKQCRNHYVAVRQEIIL